MGHFFNKLLQWFMGDKQGKILDKLVRIVLGSNLVAVLILGGIALYGMNVSLRESQNMGESLGENSYENSSSLLIKQRQEELLHIAQDNASIINRSLMDIACDVQVVARQAEKIERYPQRFMPVEVHTPAPDNYRALDLYLQYGPEVSLEPLAGHISLMANIGDWLTGMLENNVMAQSVFIASRENFALSVDAKRVLAEDKSDIPQPQYDALASDWYKSAASQEGFAFTPVRRFMFNKRLGMFCSVPYYDGNNELLGVACMQISLSDLQNVLKEINLHEGGFCFVTDKRGYVILSSQEDLGEAGTGRELEVNIKNDLRESDNPTLALTVREMVAGDCGVRQTKVDGKDYYIAFAPIESSGWSLAAAFAADDVIAPAVQNKADISKITEEKTSYLKGQMLSTMLLMVVAIIALLAAVVYSGRQLSRRFVAPISELADGVREISSGNLGKKVEVHTGDELEHLAICFNAMTDELQTYMKNLTEVTAEKERIATELSVARNIQMGALPRDFLEDKKSIQLFATMSAAKAVGGDFYDFYMLDEKHLVVTIADVSGKGVPAALFMMRAKTTLKNLMLMATAPDDFGAVMTLANQELCQDNGEMLFVTVFLAQLDLDTGEVIYVNGGHNAPLARQAGKFSYVRHKKKDKMLGMIENLSYETHRLQLSPGDMLFLYTDGVTEAMNKEKKFYTEERLQKVLDNMSGEASVKEILTEVRGDIDAFADGAEQYDDITMLGVMFCGKGQWEDFAYGKI
ncbi:SpoIIE family protein phosphatase [Selenomonas sp. KH1T6]|uniref:SpoIIE family protein phosphatase n=1 Tax=Selenomonas sp. KH1T6 TaxID=3158784 RepID=UPI0008A806AC|nr:sigma-B regulation protein RsbU (phosphoserine phosphatase) [Selenomonas ruminantium]